MRNPPEKLVAGTLTGSWIISISVQLRLVHFSRTIPYDAAQYLQSTIYSTQAQLLEESNLPQCNLVESTPPKCNIYKVESTAPKCNF